MSRPTRAIIDLEALRHNYGVARELSGTGQAMPIVKANAYGHGAVGIARCLQELAPAMGVACIEEAIELRDAGIDTPILLLEGFFTPDELHEAASRNFWLMLHNEWQLKALAKAKLPGPVRCWLKLDTGMHRLGFAPHRAGELYAQLQNNPLVHDEVVLATHFASADETDRDFTRIQIERFRQATAGIEAPCSLANSPGLLAWPEARAEWNRPGFMLYGNSPLAAGHPES